MMYSMFGRSMMCKALRPLKAYQLVFEGVDVIEEPEVEQKWSWKHPLLGEIVITTQRNGCGEVCVSRDGRSACAQLSHEDFVQLSNFLRLILEHGDSIFEGLMIFGRGALTVKFAYRYSDFIIVLDTIKYTLSKSDMEDLFAFLSCTV